MASVNVYLNFDGNCEEAFTFYKSVFGGEFPYIGRFNEMPPQEGMPPLPDASFKQGNNFSISINAESKVEADKLFNGLCNGGTVTMPMDKTFWGDYFGMFTDKFGINWMVSFNEAAGQK